MKIPMPRLYLGTMTFGWPSQTSSVVDESVAKEMTKKFITFGSSSSSQPHEHYIDTARIYAGGKTEPIVGSVLKDALSSSNDASSAVLLGTKAHPSQLNGLSPQGIREQFEASIAAMDVSSVHEYYLHQPDTENSLLESLQCVHEMIEQGKVQKLGMSNYHVDEVQRAFELCEEHNLTKPTVYQGLYNPLNRNVEKELIPLLKANGCSFVAYNPLAAGLLTGKHQRPTQNDGDEFLSGRFKNNPNYLPRFYTDANFDALDIIQNACAEEGITLLDATFKWLMRHSALTENDGILLGASSISQLDQNLDACEGAEGEVLSASVLKAFDSAWGVTEKSAFPYWRSYSSDMPNREKLDQGASYSATKKA
jgi:aflatoxin B1 aldehyde reductase